MLCITGTHDNQGNPLVVVDGTTLEAANLRAPEVARLLLFYASILEREQAAAGVAVLLAPPPPPPNEADVYALLDEAFALVAKTLRVQVVLLSSPFPVNPTTPFPKSQVPVSMFFSFEQVWCRVPNQFPWSFRSYYMPWNHNCLITHLWPDNKMFYSLFPYSLMTPFY